MEFFDVVKERRSVRKYKDQPIEKRDILKVLEAANWAPSAMNWQPWEFMVVSGEWLKQLGESYKGIVAEFARSQYDKDNSKVPSNDDFIKFAAAYGGAPVVIVVLSRRSSEHNEQKAALESACAAMENLVLAAADLGLGTCWMTGPLRDEVSLRKILSISDDREIIAVTPLGYPAVMPKPIPRVDPELKEKIKWIGL